MWPLHQTKAGWGRAWNTRNAVYDPAATLARVKVPMLWFLGARDHNVPSLETARRLEQARLQSGNQDVTVLTLATGHSFLASATGDNKEFPMLTHMAPGYWKAMEQWLAARGFSRP